jgi:hypothetical protein
MDDDLDANEEVIFYFMFLIFLLSGEKWSSQFVSLSNVLFFSNERTLITKQTNKTVDHQ